MHTAPHRRHASTARIALQCVSVDRAHAARRKRIKSAEGFVQVGEAVYEVNEVQFSAEKLNSSFSEIGLAHLHTPRHRHTPICKRQFFATQILHVAFYSTEHMIA